MKKRKSAEFKIKKKGPASTILFLERNEQIMARKITEHFQQELTAKKSPENLAHYFDFFHARTKDLQISIQTSQVEMNKNQLIHLAELINLFFCVSLIKINRKNNIIYRI